MNEDLADVAEHFDKRVALQRADDMPIGRVMLADEGGAAFLVTVNGCSCDLFRGGHKMDAEPELLTKGMDSLLKLTSGLRVLVHWFTDYPQNQDVTQGESKKVSMTQFKKALANLNEDTLYEVKAK